MIIWKKTSEHSISDGRFHIAKAFVVGEPKYTLWENTTIVGTWDTAKAAKLEAEKIKKGEK
jgi:hypothetical protein